MLSIIEFIPLFTTLISSFFFYDIFRHFMIKRRTYLFWWALGVLTFGLGTLSESIHALAGWNETNLKFWYIAGALLGGFPLAQGSVYLLMNRRFAHVTSLLFLLFIVLAAGLVVASPITLPTDFDGKLTGKVFEWKEVRYFSPFINLYAFIFLVGGALYSAHRYYRQGIRKAPFRGNIFIALGGLLPGIGGSFTRAGYVEVLFITEFLGLLLIYYGYRIIRDSRTHTV
jgi:hypothetical protein